MNVTYVTALYNIYNNNDSTLNRLKKDSIRLLTSKLNLIVYVDNFYHEIIKAINIPQNVKIILLPSDELIIYNKIMNKNGSLPLDRNHEKDTFEYLALMNTKIEFLYKASIVTDTEYIAWVDAGINKHFTNPDISFEKLEKLQIKNVETTLMPGCYKRQISFIDLCMNIWWVYSGTFFISNKKYVKKFYELSKETVEKFISAGYITWEVNIWVDIHSKDPKSINWYYGSHDDTLINIPTIYL
jgi:hypothetical protein